MEDNTQPVVDTAPVQETNSILNTEEALGYDEYVNENMPKGYDTTEVDNGIMEFAKANNFTRAQLNALRKYVLDDDIATTIEEAKTKEENLTKAIMDLHQEWGNSFNFRVSNINKMIDKADNNGELRKYLDESGLDNDPRFVRMMDKLVSAFTGEERTVVSKNADIVTPETIQGEINKLVSNKAYFDANDPNHQYIVNQVKSLYERLYGEN